MSEKLNIEVPTMAEMIARGEEPEILFWVGCAGSFDQRAQKITIAFCKILNALNIDFAILGKEESCTGDPARRLERWDRDGADRQSGSVVLVPRSDELENRQVRHQRSRAGGGDRALPRSPYVDLFEPLGQQYDTAAHRPDGALPRAL